ncbi:GDYXXLXY domain-containing protein [Flagellimonas meridianipacifica]|uniref:Putative membrane-anchored protein n=1 Tax=Flagellimonas meridianipacifica TaxID=1080225 RepID=A0A2T0MFK3_9FLAO|nr:GDYXXLXY domain-containing protein [Allomuricauda pacifica]PRX56358.1 putative membrane-anchored protein [Allomuricauda pacifica]
MTPKKATFSLFILMVLVQLFIPAKMIWDNEDVLETGKEFKFKTAPIDPNDPFRGKYIFLDFDNTTVEIPRDHGWHRGDAVYVSIEEDSDGFAAIDSIWKKEPKHTQEFVQAKVGFINPYQADRVTMDVRYPFERFYMEESKAYDAEITYRESQRDTTKTTYALVHVKDGNAVLKDVLIDGVSIKELVNAKPETP